MADIAEQGSEELPKGVLHRLLAEVYLLLDNLATSNTKALPKTLESVLFTAGKQPGEPGAGEDWLQQITAIEWPPHGNNAESTAKLIYAKDYLSRQNFPATSLSIAFTSLATETERHISLESTAGELAEQGKFRSRLHDLPLSDLARIAFPHLDSEANVFRRLRKRMWKLLLFLLVLTSFFAWNVATGNALLTRVTALQQHEKEILAQAACNPCSAKAEAVDDAPSGTVTDASPELKENTFQLCVASSNLAGWMDSQLWPGWLFPHIFAHDREMQAKPAAAGSLSCPLVTVAASRGDPSPTGAADGWKSVNVPWAAVLLAIMANTMLPVFYGVLGATACVVRTLSADIRDWRLTPRRMRLSWFKLMLGAVTAVTITLFFSPDGEGHDLGKLGDQVRIGTSALCFLAGYGVEGVFELLDSLVSRLFNLNGAGDQPAK